MKKYMLSFVFLVVMIIGFVCGCGTTTSETSGENQYQGTASLSAVVLAAETTPVFTPASMIISSIQGATMQPQSAPAWGDLSGNPLYRVYYTLREFVSPRDEGVVDYTNLYKLLYDIDTHFTGAHENGMVTTINEQTVIAPFSALGSVVCNKVVLDPTENRMVALKETAEEINAIITFLYIENEEVKKSYGVAVLKYDKIVKDFEVDLSFSVDYNSATTTTDYNLRCTVTGNTASNTFSFKYVIGNTDQYTTIVARGVSRTGENMLFKYLTSYNIGDAKYIVVPGDADENFFIAQNTSPNAMTNDPDTLPLSVVSYKDWVVETMPLGNGDMVTNTTMLNNGQGTIDIIYN